jgi:hypothetical protein
MKTQFLGQWTCLVGACWAYIPCPLGHGNLNFSNFVFVFGRAVTELPICSSLTKVYGTFSWKKCLTLCLRFLTLKMFVKVWWLPGTAHSRTMGLQIRSSAQTSVGWFLVFSGSGRFASNFFFISIWYFLQQFFKDKNYQKSKYMKQTRWQKKNFKPATFIYLYNWSSNTNSKSIIFFFTKKPTIIIRDAFFIVF